MCMVDVAQSVRASDCGSEGRRFDSAHPPHKQANLYWGVAKSVRHQTLTLAFVGSSPATPANMIR